MHTTASHIGLMMQKEDNSKAKQGFTLPIKAGNGACTTQCGKISGCRDVVSASNAVLDSKLQCHDAVHARARDVLSVYSDNDWIHDD